MLGIASLLYLNWHYADYKNFIHEKIDAEQITFTKRINSAFILITISALLLSFLIPQWAETVYLLVFPLEMVLKKIMGI